ncbi:hypothetical protein POVWA1_008360 [Plasmodium ovale wallikeri]|uniref:Uncharacterized protein n=1 Tax=Plasmodium ovale wallikeri TaxID=864142 RepID=A0A1A8YJF9_PLAOA|nr:hypothetical protein POVWA1_008360 [Plasmodium ovale wallikeri]
MWMHPPPLSLSPPPPFEFVCSQHIWKQKRSIQNSIRAQYQWDTKSKVEKVFQEGPFRTSLSSCDEIISHMRGGVIRVCQFGKMKRWNIYTGTCANSAVVQRGCGEIASSGGCSHVEEHLTNTEMRIFWFSFFFFFFCANVTFSGRQRKGHTPN